MEIRQAFPNEIGAIMTVIESARTALAEAGSTKISVHRAKRYAPFNGGAAHQATAYKCGQSPLTGRSNPNALQNQYKLRLRTPRPPPPLNAHLTAQKRRRAHPGHDASTLQIICRKTLTSHACRTAEPQHQTEHAYRGYQHQR